MTTNRITKSILFLLALSMLVGLCACGSTAVQSTPAPASESTPEPASPSEEAAAPEETADEPEAAGEAQEARRCAARLQAG